MRYAGWRGGGGGDHRRGFEERGWRDEVGGTRLDVEIGGRGLGEGVWILGKG